MSACALAQGSAVGVALGVAVPVGVAVAVAVAVDVGVGVAGLMACEGHVPGFPLMGLPFPS